MLRLPVSVLVATFAIGLTGVAPAVGVGVGVGVEQDTCSGVNIALGADIQTAVNAHPAGTTYCLAAGLYRLTAPLRLKTGDTLWGAGPSPTRGTMLSGARVMIGWVASGANWYVAACCRRRTAGRVSART